MNFGIYFIIKALTEFSDDALENIREQLQVLANWYMKQCCLEVSHQDSMIVFPEVEGLEDTIQPILNQASDAAEKITLEEAAKLREQGEIITAAYKKLDQII